MEITHNVVEDDTDSSERVLVGFWGDTTIEVPEDNVVAIHEETHGQQPIPNHAEIRILWNGERANVLSDEGDDRRGWEAHERDVGIEADRGFNVDDYEYRDR